MSELITIPSLLTGLIADLPKTGSTLRGLANLISLNPDKAKSLGWLLEKNAKKTPHKTAVIDGDKSWSYAEFNAWANQIAHALKAQGIQKGDSIAIMLENRADTLAIIAGTVKLGAVAAMINTSQRQKVLLHSLTLVQPKLFIVGDELVSAFDEVSASLQPTTHSVLWVAESTSENSAPTGYQCLQSLTNQQSSDNPTTTGQVQLKDPCFYIFTSGTTGLPKASIMSHYRWLNAAGGLGLAAARIQAKDVFYCCLPFYHNNALTVSWGSTLAAGCTMAIGRKFSASGFWEDIHRYQATVFCYIGELCRYLLAQPPSNADGFHRVHTIMGNGLRPDIWDEFQDRFDIPHIREFYGASEGNIGFVNSFNQKKTAGFCPLPYAIVQYDIDNDEPLRDGKGHLIKVAKGGTGLLIGEVTAKTPFDGYTDPAAGEKKLFRSAFKKDDCWFNSGDLVRDIGYRHIQFVDRVGDTFRWKGENVATTEVEAAVNQWPQVAESVVYGVEVPGCDGRAGMVALTPNVPLEEFDFVRLADTLQQTLPHYAQPLFIRIQTEQEVTGTFKYKKTTLRNNGFNPEHVAGPVYARLPGSKRFSLMDQSIYDSILKQEHRF